MNREKINKLMSLTLNPFDKAIAAMVEEWTGQLSAGFDNDGKIPPEVHEAVAAIEKQLHSDAPQAQDHIAAIYQERFTEEEIDTQIAFWESPVGQRLMSIGPAVQEAINDSLVNWRNNAIKTAEPILSKLLGPNIAPATPEIPPAVAESAPAL